MAAKFPNMWEYLIDPKEQPQMRAEFQNRAPAKIRSTLTFHSLIVFKGRGYNTNRQGFFNYMHFKMT